MDRKCAKITQKWNSRRACNYFSPLENTPPGHSNRLAVTTKRQAQKQNARKRGERKKIENSPDHQKKSNGSELVVAFRECRFFREFSLSLAGGSSVSAVPGEKLVKPVCVLWVRARDQDVISPRLNSVATIGGGRKMQFLECFKA